MPRLGVDIAIINTTGAILLTQREDCAAWCLPGGDVEPGESLVQAAVRECREETGLAIQVLHLVGIYSRPTWPHGGNHTVLFAARPVGGGLYPDPTEVLALAFFPADQLPTPIFWGHHNQIRDALAGFGGSIVRVHETIWPFNHQGREAFYAARDQAGVTRDQFYATISATLGPDDARIEIPGRSIESFHENVRS